ECLSKYDKDNVEAASALLDYYMAKDDLGRAEQYAEVLARRPPETDGKTTEEQREIISRHAAAHFLLADRALRGQNPKPEQALQDIKASETLPHPDPSTPNEKRWREYAVEARALQMRLDMARKLAAEGGEPPPNITREDIASALKSTLASGIAKARRDLAA